MRLKSLLALASLGCLTGLAPIAAANGRYPQAQQLVVHPNDPSFMVLRTTYGLIISRDAGQSWGWVCEAAMGYGDEDPAVAVSADGTIRVAPFSGLIQSTDGGCNFDSLTDLSDVSIADVSLDPADKSAALLLESTVPVGEPPRVRLWRSETADSATPMGAQIGTELLAFTLDAAPSQPERIYVTAAETRRGMRADGGPRPRRGFLFRTDDSGENWTTLTLPEQPDPNLGFISAIHPNDPDHLYVRVISGPFQDHQLLESRDGGESWHTLFETPHEIRGFALAPNARQLFLGVAVVPTLQLEDAGALGLFRADLPGLDAGMAVDTGLDFIKLRNEATHCLLWPNDTVFACMVLEQAGFDLGGSTDLGESFEPLLLRTELMPLECPADSDVALRCTDLWPAQCNRLGAPDCPGGPIVVPPPTRDAGRTPPPARSQDASVSPQSDAGVPVSVDSDAGTGAGSSSGCDCELARIRTNGAIPPAWTTFTILVLSLSLTRRRVGLSRVTE